MAKVFNVGGGGGSGGLRLESIAVTTLPSKTVYKTGQSFDPAGMVVTAYYGQGLSATVTGYTIAPAGPLAYGTAEVIVAYSEGGNTRTAAVPITVLATLSGLRVDSAPGKTVYEYGDALDTAGLKVSALYSDGTAREVSGYILTPTALTYLGSQTVTVTYTEDAVTAQTSFTVSVERKSISLPTQAGTLTYTGGTQSPSWNGYSPERMTMGGATSAVNAGNYTASFTPTENYRWADGSTGGKTAAWSIGKAAGSLYLSAAAVTLSAAAPTAKIIVDRAGDGAISAVSSAPSVATVSVSGNTVTISGVNGTNGAATVTVSVAEGKNHTAPAAKTVAVTASFTVYISAVPSQSGALTYTGGVQGPSWTNYDSAQLAIGGVTTATNAGTYTATFTPNPGYAWADGSTEAKSVTWSIGKAEGSMSVDPTSLTLDSANPTGTITVTRAGDGAISAVSSDPGVATVSISGDIVTVTGVKSGTVTITVGVLPGTNHTAPAGADVPVTVSMYSPVLADNTPEQIQAAAAAGLAPSLWSVGDTVPITLNGTVGILTFSNETYYAFILGFNHNAEIEGNNTIHFGFGKTADGVDIAFVDSEYRNFDNDAAFRMNTSGSNSGGWNGSYMRKTICPTFLAALPAAWQNVVVPCTKYSDNKGGGSSAASYVTATANNIWLLSEFEVHGTRNYANSAEQNYQKQYDYYKNGNSKVKYKHDATTTACIWCLRSARASEDSAFCYVNATGGAASYYSAHHSLGFAPGFMIKQPEVITFTIAGTAYQAMEGMTWGEWVESGYNTAGYKLNSSNALVDPSGKNIKYNAANAASTDYIVPGGQYTVQGYTVS